MQARLSRFLQRVIPHANHTRRNNQIVSNLVRINHMKVRPYMFKI
jgi:hypothetical protein